MHQTAWWQTARFWIPVMAGLFVITLIFVVYQAFWIIPAENRSTFLSTIIVSIISFSGTLLVLWATTRQTRMIQQKAADDLKIQRDREDRKFRYQEMDDMVPLIGSFMQKCAQYQWNMKQIDKRNEPSLTEIAAMYYQIRLKITSHHIDGANVIDNLEVVNINLGDSRISMETFHKMLLDLSHAFTDWAKDYKYND